jgi:TonB family protein
VRHAHRIRPLPPPPAAPPVNSRAVCRAALLLPLAALLALFTAAHSAAAAWSPDSGARRVVSEQNGSVSIHDGARVRVSMELGDIRVRAQASGSVLYRLRVEAPAGSHWNDSSSPRFQVFARSGSEGAVIIGRSVREHSSERFWVTLELDVPRDTPLELSTQGGNVDVGDIDGRLVCDTAGGKIRVGRVGAPARLRTAGGDVVVQDVAGDLTASTGGGNIIAGAIHGSANLRSGGGHIRVARVDGEARMETGGGNIFLDHAGANLVATTGGGRIMVGEAGGKLQARTRGGGIRVWRLAGPARIETGAGSIFLAGVASPVRATTGAGGITALFSPAALPAPAPPALAPPASTPGSQSAPTPPRTPRSSTLAEFQCNGGDLVVFLPKDISLTLDASIQGGDNYRMLIDPSFALQLKSDDLVSGKAIRAEGVMGAGGPLLLLRAVSGNILIRPVEGQEAMALPALPAAPVQAPPRRHSDWKHPEEWNDGSLNQLEISIAQMQSQLEVRQEALESYASAQELQAMRMARRSALERRAEEARAAASAGTSGLQSSRDIEYNWSSDQLSHMEELREQFAAWLTDHVIISAAQMRPRLIRRVDPVYPAKAHELGLGGAVRLRVAVARNGSIEDVKALSGHPLLAEAATDAVKQWRYLPTVLNGKPVPVLTVLTIVFRRQ